MSVNPNKLLFFVEDPGAANFLADLPCEIKSNVISTKLIAINFAAKQLKTKKINFEEIDPKKTDARQIIEEYNPNLIIVGTSQNPQSFGLDLIDFGRKNGIETIGFVDSPADSDLRFKGETRDPLKYAPDWMIVPDESAKIVFNNLGYDKENIIIAGNPNYEKIISIKKNLQSKGVDKIAFFIYQILKLTSRINTFKLF